VSHHDEAIPLPRLSVVAPARDEADNIVPLVEQVEAALVGAGVAFEFLIVDDASSDATAQRVLAMMPDRPWLRLISLSPTDPSGGSAGGSAGGPAGGSAGGGPGVGHGQSAAFRAGFAACRAPLVASLDADLQNDPADLPRLLAHLHATGADFVQGDRSAARALGDARVRRIGSIVGRLARRALLGDTVRDTGCSLRVMKREIALALPLEFKGMHRFVPVTARRLGYTVVELPVAHRPRHAGEPKYGLGITHRAVPGLVDCLVVRWMSNRRRLPVACERWAPSPPRGGEVAARADPAKAAPVGGGS
jgi:glycosyltransferase involved in cell wall biosynthesis